MAEVCYIELEPAPLDPDPPGTHDDIALEDDTGRILLEDGSCPQPGPPVPPVNPVPPLFKHSLLIPAYPYLQYRDDDNIDAFFGAFNSIAQTYLSWFDQTPLGAYQISAINSSLLDWVAEGLYGIARPVIPYGVRRFVGPLNTWPPNTITLNTGYLTGILEVFEVTDDIFKRIITWHFFKGDGQQFTINWLKRRVMRFLTGTAGYALNIEATYPISVTFGVDNDVVITITLTNDAGIQLLTAQIFQGGIASGALQTPFQFQFSVVLVNDLVPTNLTNVAGTLHITDATGWPTSATGLPAGAVWANGGSGGVVTIVPGVTPNPFATPLFFGLVTSSELLAIGGGNLPTSAPISGSLQIWNDTNIAKVAV